VSVDVTTNEEGLEEEQAGGPDTGRAAKPGQEILTYQGLHLEQKERSNKNR
jgi:hypothetical protein